jgi:N-acetylglucosamine kinase-like BadF-type ATPase
LFLDYFNRDIFPSDVRLYVQNDAVAALASGTMGKLHGCVLIAGTGSIAYGFTEDGKEARAAGAGPVLGDWGRLSLATISLSGLIFHLPAPFLSPSRSLLRPSTLWPYLDKQLN